MASALAAHAAAPAKNDPDNDKDHDSDLTPASQAIATSPLRLENLVASPDGNKLAFLSSAINQHQEKVEDYEIYVVDLASVGRTLLSATAGSIGKARVEPIRLTHNQAQEANLRWANDSLHIFFTVEVGDVSGPYRDLQPHLYWVESETGKVEQWGKDFVGPIDHYCNRYTDDGHSAIYASGSSWYRSSTLLRRLARAVSATAEPLARNLRTNIHSPW